VLESGWLIRPITGKLEQIRDLADKARQIIASNQFIRTAEHNW
jgi:hypothetical protein